MNFEEIKEQVKKNLSQKRFIHSLGVVERAEQLARIHGEDIKKARIIAMAHDIAKEMDIEDARNYVKANGIIFDEIEKEEPNLWHSKIGADIAQKQFGFTKDMMQAIIYHTTGNIHMTTMDKIIYLADKTETGRNFIDLENARNICNKNLDEGMLYVAGVAIENNIKKQSLIHPDTIHVMNQIIMNKNKKRE